MEKALGVSHYALFPETQSGTADVLSTLEPILRDGFFDAVEITWIKDERERLRVAGALSGAGVEVMFSGGPALLSSGLSLSSLDRIEREKAVDLAKRLIDMVCDVQSRNLLISSGRDPGEPHRNDALLSFRRSVEELCAYAVAQRPDDPPAICLEHFDRDVHWRQLLGPTRLAAATMAKVRSEFPNCGITLDMSHVAQLGEDLAGSVYDAGDTLIHAHIANCVLTAGDPLYGDMHPPLGVPNGSYEMADMIRFLRILDESGFSRRPCPYGRPVVSLEVRPPQGQDPWRILADHKAHLVASRERLRGK